MNCKERNKKVALSRGESWKKNLIKGKSDKNSSLIKNIRVKKGISQNTISNDLGISLATYGSIERGERPIKKPLAKFICDFYNVKLKSAFDEIEGKFLIKKI